MSVAKAAFLAAVVIMAIDQLLITNAAPLAVAIPTASSNAIDIGQFSVISATVSGGTAPYTYQWYSATPGNYATAIPGASGTTSSPTISYTFAPTAAMAPNYYYFVLQVTDTTPTTVNSLSSLSVLVEPALIAPIPATTSTVLGPNQFATISSPVSGGVLPYSYQWLQSFNGGPFTPITGANTATYTFATNSLTTTGKYGFELQVTDSASVPVTMVSPPSPTITYNSALVTTATVACLMTGGAQTDMGTCILDAIPLGLIGILLSITLGAIIYIAGEVLGYRQLTGWYRNELWELAKSVMVIIFIFSILVILSGIATAFAGNQATFQGFGSSSAQASVSTTSNLAGLYTTAQLAYLQPQLQQSYVSFSAVLGLTMGVEALKSFGFKLYFPIPLIWPFPPTLFGSVPVGVDTFILQSNYLSSDPKTSFAFLEDIMTIVVVPVLFLMQFQYDLFPIIVALGLGVFLPLGIVLRAIPLLRGIGGTMIALAMGTSIVYPTLLVFLNLPITQYLKPLSPQSGQQSSVSGCLFGGNLLLCVLQASVQLTEGAVIGASPISYALGAGAVNPDTLFAIAGGFNTGFAASINSIFPSLNFVLAYTIGDILQFMLFIVDAVIGVIIITNIARLLGGRLRLSIGGLRFA